MRTPQDAIGRLGLAVIVVAIGAAAFAMAFRSGLEIVYGTLFGGRDVLDAFRRLPPLARLAVPAVGGLAAGIIARLTAKSRAHGVGEVMEAVVLGEGRLSIRGTVWKALSSWFAIATGNSVGREGPLIQFGGSLGSAVATRAGVSARSSRALIAAGTAAGFAAAYNTPLAAVLFVVEVISGIVVIDAVVMVLIATAISTALVRATVGAGPIYGQREFAIATAGELIAHALLGLVAAFAAQGFMQTLALGERTFERARIRQPWRAATGGAIVGAMAIMMPEVTGNGYEPLNHVLDGRYPLALVGVLVVAKALATTASVSSGSPGGVFTPSLLIGGGLGLLWGHAVGAVIGPLASPGSYAVVGMAAFIAASTHAPLMASVLVFELSGDYSLVVPLVLATAIATLVSRRLRPESIYAAELRRQGIAWELSFEGRSVRRVPR